jgi:predicted P-loop ATPase
VWDGTPRLDTWLIDYFHTGDTPYVRAVGPRWLISAIARVKKPGCKADHVLVLEGPQGRQKSEALRILALRDEWFTDRLSHVSSKDAAIEVSAGVLIIEIAEMEVLTRASSSAAKSFITRREDPFRPPYGRHLTRCKRQCVFAGTINPPVGGYLKDATGARRFWPVACGRIDLEGLKRDRDQLWAEAVHRYNASQPWWLETEELERLAAAEQQLRFKVDHWQEPIVDWLGNRGDVSVTEVLEHALGISREEWTQSAQNRVVTILTNLGFVHYRPRNRNARNLDGREYRYRREQSPKT